MDSPPPKSDEAMQVTSQPTVPESIKGPLEDNRDVFPDDVDDKCKVPPSHGLLHGLFSHMNSHTTNPPQRISIQAVLALQLVGLTVFTGHELPSLFSVTLISSTLASLVALSTSPHFTVFIGRCVHYSYVIVSIGIFAGFHATVHDTSSTPCSPTILRFIFLFFFITFSLYTLKMQLIEWSISVLFVSVLVWSSSTSHVHMGLWAGITGPIGRHFILYLITIFGSMVSVMDMGVDSVLVPQHDKESGHNVEQTLKQLECSESEDFVEDGEESRDNTASAASRILNIILNNLPTVVFRFNGHTKRYIYMSDGATRITGFPVSKFTGNHAVASLVHPDDAREVMPKFDQYLKTPGASHLNLRYRLKTIDGSYRRLISWFYFSGELEDGDPIFWGISMDETEIVEARFAAAVSDAANAAKSHFLATMSHDLRTPLNCIVGMASMLKDSKALDTDEKEMVTSIWSSSHILLGMVQSVLDLSKIESNDLSSHKRCVSMKEMMELVEHTTSSVGASHKVELIMKPIPSDVPSIVHNVEVTHLQQVLLNLISNAFKFTPSGGSVTVSVSMMVLPEAHGEPQIRFDVIDTGPGIDKKDQDHIFKAFFQSDDHVSSNELGVGLGLSICKKLVESFGGRLTLESDLDHGSTFWFTLPLTECTAADGCSVDSLIETKAVDMIPESSSLLPAPAMALSTTLHVLVVDDNDVNRRMVQVMIKKIGCTCEVATNGQEAVDIIKSAVNPFDVVLMDLQMPVLDGLAAMKVIREWEKEMNLSRTRIVALTAMVTTDDVARCQSAGADGYLSKPVTIEQLKQTVYGRTLDVKGDVTG